METEIIINRKTKAEIEKLPVNDGNIYFSTDSNEIFMDNGKSRKSYGNDKKEIDDLKNEVKKNKEDVSLIENTTINSKYINIDKFEESKGMVWRYTNKIFESMAYAKTIVIPVKESQRYKVSGAITKTKTYLINYFSEKPSSETFMYGEYEADDTIQYFNDIEFIIPKGCKYVLFNNSKNSSVGDFYLYLKEFKIKREDSDKTLSESNKYADAKITGDKIKILEKKALKTSNLFNPKDYAPVCIHHDNFKREKTWIPLNKWDIGSNGNDGIKNGYSYIQDENIDDGFSIVGDYLKYTNGERNYINVARKLNCEIDLNNGFMIELGLEKESLGGIALDFENLENYKYLRFILNKEKKTINVTLIEYKNNKQSILSSSMIYDIGDNIKIYYKDEILYIYCDDTFEFFINCPLTISNICIMATKNYDCIYKYINVFNLSNWIKREIGRKLDKGDKDIYLSVVSANPDRYNLVVNGRFSQYFEKMCVMYGDKIINNGYRCERSFHDIRRENLRDIKISFDVLFPLDFISDEHSNIFIQMHDTVTGHNRQAVPFELIIRDDKIYASTKGTYRYGADYNEVVEIKEDCILESVKHNHWYHFEIFLHERYEKEQLPFTEVKINGQIVFQSRTANCFNDIIGGHIQYGSYMGMWRASEDYPIENYKKEVWHDNYCITY